MESMRDSNKFDHEVKSKFEGFTPSVPTELWSKIESQLSYVEPIKPAKRVRFSYFIYGAIAASILIAFLFWKFDNTEEFELQKKSVATVIETPLEENVLLRDGKEDAELIVSEGVVSVEHLDEVKNSAVSKKTGGDNIPLEPITAV